MRQDVSRYETYSPITSRSATGATPGLRQDVSRYGMGCMENKQAQLMYPYWLENRKTVAD
jgi:hypothetical protein